MGYHPIDSYGLIGNMRSAALVAHDGSIDWLCLPAFDSPSVFAAILDDAKGGRFTVTTGGEERSASQMYWPDTNVLLTRHRSSQGVVELTDFMPVHGPMERDRAGGLPDLVRVVRGEDGPVEVRARCLPAFEYAGEGHRVHRVEGDAGPGVVIESESGRERLALMSDREPEVRPDGSVCWRYPLDTGEFGAFAIKRLEPDDRPTPCRPDAMRRLLGENIAYWRSWIRQCTYHGRWAEAVRRSALALKLLTYEPTGAIVAAPTTSLPERIGGRRNWDYRYVWLRDAGFMVYAMLRIGLTEEPARFMDWLRARCDELEPDGHLRPLYGIDGRHELPERELPHLEGYRGTGPVRVGNDASGQIQLDAAGALLDAAYLHNKHGSPTTWEHWSGLVRILDWVCRSWDTPDDGIWEFRSEPRNFVFSRMMCWVALDRGMRIARARSLPGPLDYWRTERDKIYRQVMDRGWSDELGAFRIDYQTEALDAGLLLMPLVYFTAPDEPRTLKTIRKISQPIDRGGLMRDFLVRRYNTDHVEDGVGGPEGAFNICTLWLVEALTRAGRQRPEMLDEAHLLFDRVLHTGRPHGLFAEQIGDHREALGNYPQGLTHLALISAAFNLNRALGD